MKILQINCVYKKGSTGKIVYDIHQCLHEEGFESVVCYGRGVQLKEPHVYKFCTELESKVFHLFNKFGWLMYAVCPLSTFQLIRIIKKEQPDVVHLHCINGYCVDIYKLLKFLGKSNIKTVVTHHAEFLYTGNCGHAYSCDKYQKATGCCDCQILKEASGTGIVDRTHKAWVLMKEAFSCFKRENIIFTAVSPWVVNRSALSPIVNKFDCRFVTNGLDTSVFHPSSIEETQAIRARLPYPKRKMILHVAAAFTTNKNNLKGGYYIKQLAEMLPQYQFVVVATYISDVEGLPDNVLVWGRANGQKELAALYSAADVTVILSKRETFSMITAESLCCGTPLVGFVAGGPESIALKEYTSFVEYGNVEQLQDAVQEFAELTWNRKEISDKSMQVYSKEKMSAGYIDIYKELKG